MTASVLQLTQAGVRWGRVQALQGVSMQVRRGECVALVGSNGSGKSTLLRLAHGLVLPTAGRVQRDVSARQAFVFQKPYVLRATVLTNVALAAWLQAGAQPVPTAWAQAKASAMQALTDVDLQALATRQARTLSGGQQQRLTFARALCTQPDVLLLDEPTASLAPQAKRDVEALMQQCTQRGTTLLFASHNLGQVKRLATRVICLDAGRVVADMPTAQFFNNALPQALAAEHFMESKAI
jgi:tungstate transport system ATP-binding protein